MNHDLISIEEEFLGGLVKEAPLTEFTQNLIKNLIKEFASESRGDLQPLIDSIISLADSLEKWGGNLAKFDLEPKYHNRQHAREVMFSLCLFLKQEDEGHQEIGWPNSQWPLFALRDRLLMLIAALGHDFLHTGSVNSFPYELELKSSHGVEAVMQGHNIPPPEITFVKELIMSTEFAYVSNIHDSLMDCPTHHAIKSSLRASIVLTEADIFPNILPCNGLKLASQLSDEWSIAKVIGREDPKLPETRKKFLKQVRFSSPHAKRLKVAELIQSQLDSNCKSSYES